jgi:hypothetical protein
MCGHGDHPLPFDTHSTPNSADAAKQLNNLPSATKNYSSMVHFKYPPVKDYLWTWLTRKGTSFSKALKYFMCPMGAVPWIRQSAMYVICVLCHGSGSQLCMSYGCCAMDQAGSCRPVSRQAQVQSQASPCGNCGGQSGSDKSSSPNTSQFSAVSHFTNTPYSFIPLSLMLHNLSNW